MKKLEYKIVPAVLVISLVIFGCGQSAAVQEKMLGTTILLFIATEFFLSLYPGPAVLLVLSQGIRHGGKASMSGTIGILTGNVVYFSASALGLGAVLIASEKLFLVIKVVGAVYLLYLGDKNGHPIMGWKRFHPP